MGTACRINRVAALGHRLVQLLLVLVLLLDGGGRRFGVVMGIIMSSAQITTSSSSTETDIAALLATKAALIDPHGVLANWLTTSSNAPCSWFGVTCSSSPENRVTEINLEATGLQGPLAGGSTRCISRLLLQFLNEEDPVAQVVASQTQQHQRSLMHF
jgi:hypothetical protein